MRETDPIDTADEQAFLKEHGGTLRALAGRRGPCPPVERLTDAQAAAAPDEALRNHLALCPSCRELLEIAGGLTGEPPAVDDISWQRTARRLDARPAPWEPPRGRLAAGTRSVVRWLAAAVILLAAGAAVRWELARNAAVPPPVSVTRGASLQALEPAGAIEALERFSWAQAMPLELTYRVTLKQGDAVVFEGETGSTTLEAPASLRGSLVPGSYSWRVVGLDAAGRVVAASPWVSIVLSGGPS